jgi:hypothetical protein
MTDLNYSSSSKSNPHPISNQILAATDAIESLVDQAVNEENLEKSLNLLNTAMNKNRTLDH